MAHRPTVDQVEYSRAIRDLAEFLTSLGVADPDRLAGDFMRELVHKGWRHTRPALEMEPIDETPADPQTAAESLRAARAAAEAAARRTAAES